MIGKGAPTGICTLRILVKALAVKVEVCIRLIAVPNAVAVKIPPFGNVF